MKTPKFKYEYRYKVKVEGQKVKLFWANQSFNIKNPVYDDLISKGFTLIGNYRINQRKYVSGFCKQGLFSKKIINVFVIKLSEKRRKII